MLLIPPPPYFSSVPAEAPPGTTRRQAWGLECSLIPIQKTFSINTQRSMLYLYLAGSLLAHFLHPQGYFFLQLSSMDSIETLENPSGLSMSQ